MMTKKVSKCSHLVNGEKIMVPRVKHLRCPKCGEGMLDLEDARDLRLRAFDIYREKYGLLSAEEIPPPSTTPCSALAWATRCGGTNVPMSRLMHWKAQRPRIK